MKYFAFILLYFFSLNSFAQKGKSASSPVALDAAQSIKGADLLQHTTVLASDEYEGRAPGSKGEELTIKYISENFKKLGLLPGNPDGTYTQNVPLYGYRSIAHASLKINGKNLPLTFPDNFVAVSRKYSKEVQVDSSELVFVGYGIVAPEYGWDDYKGMDVKGKTIVMLVNDPPVKEIGDTSKYDGKMFKGNAMTYYGRWTYKYEIASEKGAAAAIIIHETGPAGYPFEVVTGSWGHENFDVRSAGADGNRVSVESWISRDKAKEIFEADHKNFEVLKKAASSRDFKPVPLNGKISFHIQNSLKEVLSKNICAKKEGTDAVMKNEWIIYSAHWDHLGKDTALKGDQIFNGAFDNASGIAGLLELAEAFTKIKTKRSVLFLALTGEEEGLLGSKFYAENPLYPLKKTLANINMDGINPLGKTADMIIVGIGQSSLEGILSKRAASHGRHTTPEDTPEKGFYYRSDHFEFAKKGIPALYTRSGIEFIGQAKEYGIGLVKNYLTKDYHKVSDEVKTNWTFEGGADDLRLFFEVGLEISENPNFPVWLQGSEFRSARIKMMKD